MVALKLKTGSDELALLELPWSTPLADWPEDWSLAIPAGLHRHVVRFVTLNGVTLALKELPPRLAEREFDLLDRLREEAMPSVRLVGIVTDRVDAEGEPMEAVLVTRHLRYSLPYRHLFAEDAYVTLRDRVIDALVILLVRIHLEGFFWGDCSLNNALFRRDAGSLQAYLVDTETASWYATLSDGQRQLDLDIAVENVLGGLFDLEAEGLLADDVDPENVADLLLLRYQELWSELRGIEEVPTGDLGRIHQRLARLNALGFDTEEYELHQRDGIARFRPTIVEEGHHRRLLQRLTGIEAQENQARRLLSALRGYAAWLSQSEGAVLPDAVAAYRWLTERWTPTLERLPTEVRGRLEDAEVYHQILEHNWYLNERLGVEQPLEHAVQDYIDNVLVNASDERTVLP